MPGEHRQRQARADARDAHQALEQGLLERGREPEELKRVLADVGVHAQRDVAAHVADRGERGQRHVHFVADSACFNDDPRGMLLEAPVHAAARS